jgi:hypothetical protein
MRQASAKVFAVSFGTDAPSFVCLSAPRRMISLRFCAAAFNSSFFYLYPAA